MNRRRMLTLTGASVATLLAGCSTGNETDTEEPGPTDTVTDEPASTDTPTDESEGLSIELARDHLQTVYEEWANNNSADGFLATLHSTNSYPEEEVRNGVERIDFAGTLNELNAEGQDENPDEATIRDFIVDGTNITEDDVATFTDVQTVIIQVTPSIDGEATTDEQKNFKSFLKEQKPHFLAVEDGEWRLVT